MTGRIPDTKAQIMGYLTALLDVPVLSKRPDQDAGQHPASEFVVVTVTGGDGRRTKVLQETQVTFDCAGPTLGKAFDTAQALDAAMYALPQADLPITQVEGWAPQENPDPDTGQPRMTVTYRVLSKITA